MSVIATDGREHFIYRAFDGAGELVYIGCTVNPETRFAWHRSRTPWFGDVDRVEWEAVGLIRQVALAIEAEAIAAECPRENVLYNGSRAGGPPAIRVVDPDEPYGPLVCDCAEPDAIWSDFGMCQVCKRKPLELMAVPS